MEMGKHGPISFIKPKGQINMRRSNRENPCPICKRSSDGCLYTEDGTAAICVRTVEGSVKMAGQAGYLHILKPGDFKPKPVVKKRPAIINWNTLNDCYVNTYRHPLKDKPFDAIRQTLRNLETGWDGEAYTFPVRNANDEIIGITRRWPDGTKGMVKGSQAGIYIPRIHWPFTVRDWTLFICEGASDTATAIDMDLFAIGRVSCQTGKDHITLFCMEKKPTQIVIIADNDSPGVVGAELLCVDLLQRYDFLTVPRPIIKVITPPTGIKDLREWRQNGLTHVELVQIANENLEEKL